MLLAWSWTEDSQKSSGRRSTAYFRRSTFVVLYALQVPKAGRIGNEIVAQQTPSVIINGSTHWTVRQAKIVEATCGMGFIHAAAAIEIETALFTVA
jgi:hypothetical protein